MEKEILIKYLNNHCTESELSEVLDWVRKSALDEEVKRWSLETWNSYQESDITEDDGNFAAIFEKVKERIDRNKSNEAEAGKTVNLHILLTWATRAAAVMLIPVLAFLFYTLSEKKVEYAGYAHLATDSLEVMAPAGSKTIVQLSDGSEVHLNYGSKIKYPHFFSGNSRGVTLSGEGFFKVAHNPEKPFIVKAKNLNIKAVGTTFNVLAYPDNDHIETTLVSGKVILEEVEKGGMIKSLGTMQPGLHADYNIQTGSVTCTEGPIEKYISWTEGKLIFDDTPLLEVAEQLSRVFNVDFEVRDEVKGYKYTVTIIDDPLYQILDLMSIATPITYKILPRIKLSDGTYSKQRIVIKKRS